jgi:hypothetical protein
MSSKTKSIASIMFVLALVFGCFAAVAPAIAAPIKENLNQNFEGTPVDIYAVASETVFVNDEAQIVITIENNVLDRGLPQVSIWVNGERVAFYSDIAKGATVEYVVEVDTAVAGEQTFDIEVWTRKNNVNYADLLGEGTITIDVVQPEPIGRTPAEWRDAITDVISQTLNGANIQTIVVQTSNGGTQIILEIDGEPHYFTSNGNTNSDKSCVIDGVTYTINIQGNSGGWRVLIA